MRPVTEKDFRKDEFKEANVEDYEFRDDGEIVRKDRWEIGIRHINSIINGKNDFEIEEIIKSIENLTKRR